MNKFVTTALALAAAGSVTFAEPEDNEWLELDSEISSLAQSLQPLTQEGMGWTALIRVSFSYSDDDAFTGGAAFDDIVGFKFEDVDLAFWGSVGEYGWRISFDIDDGEAGFSTGDVDIVLEDAFAFFDCGEYVTVLFGQFKPRVFRDGYIDPENLLFIDRTVLGSAFDIWDVGLGAEGYWEEFGWWISAQNGGNGQRADHIYALRVEYYLNGGAGLTESAMYGTEGEWMGTFGATYVMADELPGPDNGMWGLDAWGTFGQFGFGAEVASLDDDFALATSGDFSRTASPIVLDPDTTPWDITLSWLFNPEWELGGRFESTDNSDDEDLFSIVLAWYLSAMNVKWQIQYTDISGDGPEGSVLQIGLVVGSTR